MPVTSDHAGSSSLGRFFRRLADIFDRLGQRGAYAGSRTEIDVVALGILFVGIVFAGTWIHGWHFLFWNFVFALFFCAAVWLVFYSARWQPRTRALFISLLMLLSLSAATERVIALFAFVLLFFMVLRSALPAAGGYIRRDTVSVMAVALLCFSAYDAFAGVLEWRRNAALEITGALKVSCVGAAGITRCRAGEVAFSVPEYWRRGSGSNLVRDLASVAKLKIYTDSATDNTIAFAAFSSRAGEVMQQVNNFLYVQKGFLRARGAEKKPLVPQLITKGADVQLFGLSYQSATPPGYLAGSSEAAALILVHERRSTTWLFIVDGTDISAREFILHRIISGFH